MPQLLIRFPARRYHATPWGHHVNEGLIEWPPSPWRILRAMLATGYGKLGWPDAGPTPQARTLIEKLAGVLPEFHLPSASGAHTRHYMPLAILEKGREKTTLVFDTWAQVDKGTLGISWNVSLSDQETAVLQDIANNLNYLGRSESWSEARLLPDGALPQDERITRPCNGNPHPGPGWEQVALLAPVASPVYSQWREQKVQDELAKAGITRLTGEKPSKVQQTKTTMVQDSYPPDIVACLQVQSNWLRSLGWSQPPGSQRVLYWRTIDAVESGAPRPVQPRPRGAPVEAVLLSLANANRNDHALPSITRTLPEAELLHGALVAQASRLGKHSETLTGCDEDGNPLKTFHRHAHVLPLDLDEDGHLEHFLIWAPDGLDEFDQAAIRAVRQTFSKGAVAPLRLGVAAACSIADLSLLPEIYGQALRCLFQGAETWRSVTPFVPPRFLKQRGRNTIEGQITAELESRGLPQPMRITILDPQSSPRFLRHRHFIRSRRFGPIPPVDRSFSVELQFAEPVSGPILIGYGSHFGLGTFASRI